MAGNTPPVALHISFTDIPRPTHEGYYAGRRINKRTVTINSMKKNANILVVDDDSLNRQTVARTLAHAGFNTVTAANGEEALDCLNREQFDAVVSDVRMPGMDGIELLQNIRARFSRLPVILMTGLIEDDIRAASFTWGATALFQKPVNRADLILTITGQRMPAVAVEECLNLTPVNQ